MSIYKDKKILVTGGTGMIGRQLVELLIKEGAKIRVVSLDDQSRAHPQIEFIKLDLADINNCIKVCEGMDYVFHLAGVKGNPKMNLEKPATFFMGNLTPNINMLEAARLSNVKRYLYTSTVGVYAPAEVFYEDDVWKTFPSENDKFAGWAKRMGELQVEAYKIQYKWRDIFIVRPANVYGIYDNFNPNNAMVIPSLIRRALEGENPLVVWGDGSQIRDFIHARDVARGMMFVMNSGIDKPVNLASGKGYTIKEIVEIILDNLKNKPKIIWDSSKPSGDKKRLLDTKRAESIGFTPQISLQEGIKEVMDWYTKNKDIINKRYNAFTQNEKP